MDRDKLTISGKRNHHHLNVEENNTDAKRILIKELLIIIENVEKFIEFTLWVYVAIISYLFIYAPHFA